MWNCLWQSGWSPTLHFSQKYRVVFWHEAYLRCFPLPIQWLIALSNFITDVRQLFCWGEDISCCWFSKTSIICINNTSPKSSKSNLRSPSERLCWRYSWYVLFTDRSKKPRKTGHHHFLLRWLIMYKLMFWSRWSTPPIPLLTNILYQQQQISPPLQESCRKSVMKFDMTQSITGWSVSALSFWALSIMMW